MKCHRPLLPFSSKGSLAAKNSENREWSGSVHTQRVDRNNRGYRQLQQLPTAQISGLQLILDLRDV
jgi:hypothetical protein